MTPFFRLPTLAPIVCATMTAGCAGSLPTSSAAPPRLTLPAMASRPCDLHRLPPTPTQGDLEVGYMTRGAQIATCDAARRLAVDTLMAERSAADATRPDRRTGWRPWRRP